MSEERRIDANIMTPMDVRTTSNRRELNSAENSFQIDYFHIRYLVVFIFSVAIFSLVLLSFPSLKGDSQSIATRPSMLKDLILNKLIQAEYKRTVMKLRLATSYVLRQSSIPVIMHFCELLMYF